MTVERLLVISALTALGGALPRHWRGWALLLGSLLALFWLQPTSPIRYLDFWFPTASLLLTIFVWSLTRPDLLHDRPGLRSSLIAASILVICLLILGLTRYSAALCCLTASRPPEITHIALAIVLGGAATALPILIPATRRLLIPAAIIGVITLLVILKTDRLAMDASAWLRSTAGQSVQLASALDLRWLGFSYLAFRLLHALRDLQAGKLPAYSLGEFVTYAVFFPTLSAGPIDRLQRWAPELRTARRLEIADWIAGGQRILMGAFQKFVLADSLALIALTGQNAAQVKSSGWAWVLLYAFTLRIYFDFSGYTDIALGLGRLLGFHLPENFDRPYLKTNLTTFWNSWHITLAQWFRAYFFNPLVRALRTGPRPLPVWGIVLICQISTMLLIGLWHGVTWNYAAWGAWHGVGLFIHNRWSDWLRPRLPDLSARPNLQRALQISGWLLTFNYVTLGWVWFALPDLSLSGHFLRLLFGLT